VNTTKNANNAKKHQKTEIKYCIASKAVYYVVLYLLERRERIIHFLGKLESFPCLVGEILFWLGRYKAIKMGRLD
ncbi:hypothetical protein, partial [Cysteiniphilum sp. 6C5]|uniref:hypothetical protein n=1 Tax=unclassified Cysteiniphilum TaxID=2610889 RepID=UPI003F8762AA